MMGIAILEKLKCLIEKFGPFGKPISEETKILSDLGIDGQDAVELFESIEVEFDINLEGLDLRKYFNDECFELIPISYIIRVIKGDKIPKKSKTELTISHVLKSIEAKKWLDPEEFEVR